MAQRSQRFVFDEVAELYAAVRPSYPEELVSVRGGCSVVAPLGCAEGFEAWYLSWVTDREQQLQVGDVTLVWGNATGAKARLREESVRRFQALPIGERLRAALELLVLARREPIEPKR